MMQSKYETQVLKILLNLEIVLNDHTQDQQFTIDYLPRHIALEITLMAAPGSNLSIFKQNEIKPENCSCGLNS